ncbi:hypothetical protein FGO68_gene650 [Halteria grandinella]|uniref:Uncharacterized protein n=1 Tax=Halteria grandinella TaxID=5974 RepID=A0A8J8P0M4_HALGN|nr:hypothetical protein FGO68_gene650 [Halteria grandinella]
MGSTFFPYKIRFCIVNHYYKRPYRIYYYCLPLIYFRFNSPLQLDITQNCCTFEVSSLSHQRTLASYYDSSHYYSLHPIHTLFHCIDYPYTSPSHRCMSTSL